jgi:hypothetical protein
MVFAVQHQQAQYFGCLVEAAELAGVRHVAAEAAATAAIATGFG